MMVPIVAVVPESVVEILQPLVDEMVEKFEQAWHKTTTPGFAVAMRLNGWTPEMIAWGQILKAASEVELDLVVQS